MKIINMLTGIVFELSDSDAESLLSASPDLFAKVGKNNKIVKSNKKHDTEGSVLSKILDE